jgi:hypothetical protein
VNLNWSKCQHYSGVPSNSHFCRGSVPAPWELWVVASPEDAAVGRIG